MIPWPTAPHLWPNTPQNVAANWGDESHHPSCALVTMVPFRRCWPDAPLFGTDAALPLASLSASCSLHKTIKQLHPVRTLNPLPLNSPARCTKDLNSNMYISYVDHWFGCTWALLNSTIILVSSLQRIVFHCCKPSPSTICLIKPNFDRDTLTYSLLPLAGCWETFLSSPVTEFCNQH